MRITQVESFNFRMMLFNIIQKFHHTKIIIIVWIKQLAFHCSVLSHLRKPCICNSDPEIAINCLIIAVQLLDIILGSHQSIVRLLIVANFEQRSAKFVCLQSSSERMHPVSRGLSHCLYPSCLITYGLITEFVLFCLYTSCLPL